jgi:hypothetical protein
MDVSAETHKSTAIRKKSSNDANVTLASFLAAIPCPPLQEEII